MIDVTLELTTLGKQEAEQLSDASRDAKYAILSMIYESDDFRIAADELQSATGMNEIKFRKTLKQLARRGYIKKAQ